MELFKQVGAELEAVWRAQDYDEAVFPALAAEALKKADLQSQVTPWEVVEWTLAQSELPRQKDPSRQVWRTADNAVCRAAISHRRVFLARGHYNGSSTRFLWCVLGPAWFQHS